MTDKPTPTDAAAPECLTCSDHGAVGNILTAEPCPDCTRLNAQPAPATQPPIKLGEVSDAMVLAALQVQYPATYGQYLRHPAAGPKTSVRTEAEIDTARRMIAAALAAGQATAAPVQPAAQQGAQHLAQALTDRENQPNQYGVEFGMSGTHMHFKVGNQLFKLAYEPDEQEEFDFMKRMLVNAFSIFTHDVKTAPQPTPTAQADSVQEDAALPDGCVKATTQNTARHGTLL